MWLQTRKAIIKALKNDPQVTAVVPADQIYPQAVDSPAWPFIKTGAPSGSPFDATCMTGDDYEVTIHCFAQPEMSGDQLIKSAEDSAAEITGLIGRSLNKFKLVIDADNHVLMRKTGEQLLVDAGEKDSFHGLVFFTARSLTSV